jgi:hypothetical protein
MSARDELSIKAVAAASDKRIIVMLDEGGEVEQQEARRAKTSVRKSSRMIGSDDVTNTTRGRRSGHFTTWG